MFKAEKSDQARRAAADHTNAATPLTSDELLHQIHEAAVHRFTV